MRLEDALRRERRRGQEEREGFEREAKKMRESANEQVEAETMRVRQEEEGKRRILTKKHAVTVLMLRTVNKCIFLS